MVDLKNDLPRAEDRTGRPVRIVYLSTEEYMQSILVNEISHSQYSCDRHQQSNGTMVIQVQQAL